MDRCRQRRHRRLRGADLVGVGVDPLQAGAVGDSEQRVDRQDVVRCRRFDWRCRPRFGRDGGLPHRRLVVRLLQRLGQALRCTLGQALGRTLRPGHRRHRRRLDRGLAAVVRRRWQGVVTLPGGARRCCVAHRALARVGVAGSFARAAIAAASAAAAPASRAFATGVARIAGVLDRRVARFGAWLDGLAVDQAFRFVVPGRDGFAVVGRRRGARDFAAVQIVPVAASAAPAIAPTTALAIAVRRLAASGVGLGVDEPGRGRAVRGKRGLVGRAADGRGPVIASAAPVVAAALVAPFLARLAALAAAIAATLTAITAALAALAAAFAASRSRLAGFARLTGFARLARLAAGRLGRVGPHGVAAALATPATAVAAA
ncbi:MAG: hypothetical protein ACXWCL_17105, partial [Caldimonas sp.]